MVTALSPLCLVVIRGAGMGAVSLRRWELGWVVTCIPILDGGVRSTFMFHSLLHFLRFLLWPLLAGRFVALATLFDWSQKSVNCLDFSGCVFHLDLDLRHEVFFPGCF